MPDYSQGKIYAIKSPSCDSIYIGSTTKKYLSQRMATHRCNYIGWFKNNSDWYSSFLVLSFEDAYIELIEEYPCKSKEELVKRERNIIDTFDNCVNSYRPYQTIEEHKKQKKIWEQKNKKRRIEILNNFNQRRKLAQEMSAL